jgi:hypothetical protein
MFMGPCIVIIFWYVSNKMQCYAVYFIWKLLYMFRVAPSTIIRSANNCIYSIWYPAVIAVCCYCGRVWTGLSGCAGLSAVGGVRHPQHTLTSSNSSTIAADSNNGGTPDAVDTVVCTPDDGWWYHLKCVEQFADKINCVMLHLVGYILEYFSRMLVSTDISIRCHNSENLTQSRVGGGSGALQPRCT